MKVTAEMLEAALRRKRSAVSERAGPAKRGWREGRGEAAVAPRVIEALVPAVESAREDSVGGAVLAPVEVEPEEGEIGAANEMVLVDLDPEEETPAAAEPAEVGGTVVANDPPAPIESGVERTPPPTGVEVMEIGRSEIEKAGTERAVAERGCPERVQAEGARTKRRRPGRMQAEPKRRSAGMRRSGRREAGAESSSRRSTHRPTQTPPDELPGGPARLPPRLLTLSDAGQATALLARTRTSASNEEVGR